MVRKSTNIYYGAELYNSQRRKCPHCQKTMVVSNKALKGYPRDLRVVRTNTTRCPYCLEEMYPDKKQ